MAVDLTAEVLFALSTADGPIFSQDTFPSHQPETVKANLDRLGSREMIQYEKIDTEELRLTPEGQGIAQNGSHEARVFEAVRSAMEGVKIKDLPEMVGHEAAKVGQGTAFKLKWIEKDRDVLKPAKDSIKDTVSEQLQMIRSTKLHPDAKTVAELRKRKLITVHKISTYKISKGTKYSNQFVKEETDLTADMLVSGAWKTVKLKPYNFEAKGAPASSGALHPLNKVRHEFRQIFFEMGFEEMQTNRFVETGFWNFDALFVPQQHPARDLQDTFFISDPPRADPPREEPSSESLIDSTLPSTTKSREQNPPSRGLDYKQYWDDVRAVHQAGKYGSIGYRYPWSEDESLKLVLRTHTTAISTRMLHKLALDPRPARYFSIDRVFRNETVDQTHLAEFHQVEGVIADFGLTLGGLIGFMEVFFRKMGIVNLRFKPAYNPYTEPSLEIFSWHEGLKKWVEIGNSGMFRPEMLLPMGLPEDLRVYGWGLSLERPTMIK
jgi:phenylalanyl-tRNA synthetase alpha chain